MFLWKGYDSYGLDRSTKQDEEGILQASKNRMRFYSKDCFVMSFVLIVNHLIEEESKHGIPAERIVSSEWSSMVILNSKILF